MDFGYFGVVDICLVVFALIMAVVGFKNGFMKKLLSHIGILVIILVAFFYCQQFAQMLIGHDIIYPAIHDTIFNNMSEFIKNNSIPENSAPGAAIALILGIPEFLGNLIANGVGFAENATAIDIVQQTSGYIAESAMIAISFVILVIGLLIVLAIIKGIVNVLRNVGIVRFLDGLLGIVYYIAVGFIFVSILFYGIHLCMGHEWFQPVEQFLVIDMQLDNPDVFRLSKTIYDGNIISRILGFLGL